MEVKSLGTTGATSFSLFSIFEFLLLTGLLRFLLRSTNFFFVVFVKLLTTLADETEDLSNVGSRDGTGENLSKFAKKFHFVLQHEIEIFNRRCFILLGEHASTSLDVFDFSVHEGI